MEPEPTNFEPILQNSTAINDETGENKPTDINCLQETSSLDIKNVLQFLEIVYNLKDSARKGWEIRNIQNPERIAGHMYAMGIMTFLLGNDSSLDRVKCMQLALVHDLPECIVGDITPYDGISIDRKHMLEQEAMEKLAGILGDDVGKIMEDIYNEYRAQETPEARFVKDLDKFDMIFTAALYEKRSRMPGSLQEFFDCTEGKFEHPLVRKLASGLSEYRKNMFNT